MLNDTYQNKPLSGVDEILKGMSFAEKKEDAAGEAYEDNYKKKSGKKSKDYDGDGNVEDETDEYAGVKDKAIKNATEKEDEKNEKEDEKKEKEKKESIDFSSILDDLTEEDLLFLTDDLIEEVVEEFFLETLEEGFEIDELEALLIEQVESELTYLSEAKVTTGHDTDVKPEVSKTNKLSKIKAAVGKAASFAKRAAQKVAGGVGAVAGSAVAGYKNAAAQAKDSSSSSSSSAPRATTATATKKTPTSERPGIVGRVANALRKGLKRAVHGAGKAVGKVVKTAKAGYDAGRGKSAPESTPVSSPASAAKPAPSAAKKPAAKKKGGNLDNLLKQIRSEEVEIEEGLDEACWKGYKAVGMKMKGGKQVPNCVPKEEYVDLERDMLEEGYTFEQVLEVIEAYEDGFEVIFEEDGVIIGEYIDEALTGERYKKAVKKPGGTAYSRKVSADPAKRATRGGRGGESDFGAGDRGAGNKAARRAGTYQQEEFVIDEEAEFLSDVEMVADWLYAEGIIEDEDQFFELMEDLTEEELDELYDVVSEATAMAKRGYDETKIRNKIASKTGGGEAADRATKLENQPTYGDSKKAQQRQNLARKQRGDFRKTTSSNPGLHGYGHKSDDPAVKAKQAARGKQRGALTPKEKKDLNMGYEMIGNSLEEGGLEVRNYSWREVMEQQYARNNPEKYEADQKKKTSKGAMPPRGDKRREDFEKWYAKNVR